MNLLIVTLLLLCWCLRPVSAASSEDRLPKLYMYSSGERWTEDLGRADTPLQAFFTWRQCYVYGKSDYCAAVGIIGQKFRRGDAEFPSPEDEDFNYPDHWIFSQRTLGDSDITLLGGEQAWTRSGHVEIAFYDVFCEVDASSETCAQAASKLPIDRYGHWAYFKRVGSAWHLAGWSETPYQSHCMEQDPADPYYHRECALAFSPFDEGFRRLIAAQGWLPAESDD